ncbi:MAG: hypothetical protein ACJ75H_06490 [Thermoanaerobaculia bacterium]
MIKNPRGRKNRIRRELLRAGGGTSATNSLDILPAEEARTILGDASLAADEEPLLACFRDPSEWYLITTQRLIWKQGHVLKSLAWEDVHGVQQGPSVVKALVEGKVGKNSVEELEIFDAEDVRYVLRLEPGDGYYLMWSSIVALCSGFLHEPEFPVFDET